MNHLAPEEKQYYSAALAQTHCFSTNEPQGGQSTITDFGNFLNDVSKMSFSNQDPTLKSKCFSQASTPIDQGKICLYAISGNHSQYGGLLGPVPVSGGYMRDSESGKLQYEGVDSKNGLLRNLGLSHAVTSAVTDGNWVITDKTDPKNPKTATLKLGDTDRNPFYCSGKGFCGSPDFVHCTCESGYESSSGTCTKIPPPTPPPTASKCDFLTNLMPGIGRRGTASIGTDEKPERCLWPEQNGLNCQDGLTADQAEKMCLQGIGCPKTPNGSVPGGLPYCYEYDDQGNVTDNTTGCCARSIGLSDCCQDAAPADGSYWTGQWTGYWPINKVCAFSPYKEQRQVLYPCTRSPGDPSIPAPPCTCLKHPPYN